MEPQVISKKTVTLLRNLVFGVEDSLVSTVGLLSGIAVAGTSRDTIFLAGVVLIFVEAFSMGVGSFISEHAVESYSSKENADHSHTTLGGVVMFVSYFVAGFIPLFPYMVADVSTAFTLSILASLIALFGLGVLTGKLFRLNIWSRGLQMFVLGGVAILLGVAVGKAVEVLLR